MKLKAPWYYLIWSPPAMIAEHEVALARLTRRKGMFYMLRMFWQILTADEGRFTWGCAKLFFAQNYLGFICAIGFFTESDELLVAGGAWILSLVFGTVRYIGWLIWLLNRWPPLSSD